MCMPATLLGTATPPLGVVRRSSCVRHSPLAHSFVARMHVGRWLGLRRCLEGLRKKPCTAGICCSASPGPNVVLCNASYDEWKQAVQRTTIPILEGRRTRCVTTGPTCITSQVPLHRTAHVVSTSAGKESSSGRIDRRDVHPHTMAWARRRAHPVRPQRPL